MKGGMIVNPYYLLAPVLLPVMTGAAVLGLRPKERRKREILVMGGILAASAVIGALVVNGRWCCTALAAR